MGLTATVAQRASICAALALLLAGCQDHRPAASPDAGQPASKPSPGGDLHKLAAPANDATAERFRVPLEDSPRAGSDDALVTAVLFGDLTDRATAGLFARLERLVRDEPRELRWVFKHDPAVRPGDTGLQAAAAATWAADQGRFPAFARALLAAPGRVDPARLAAAARAAGLDPAGLPAALADPEREARVGADRRLAARLAVRAAPGLFLNGRRTGLEEPVLAKALERESAEARALVERGTQPAQLYEALTRTGRRSAWMKIRAPARPVRVGDRGKGRSRGPDDLQTVFVPPGAGITRGLESAPVEMIVFVELGCSLCARMFPVIDKLVASHPKDLRVVVRVLPDRRKRRAFLDTAVVLQAMAGDPRSLELLEAALNGKGALDALRSAANRLGVDARSLSAALQRPEPYLAELAANRAAADRAGVRGSPYLFIDGRPIPGATGTERLERMIAEELARFHRD